MPTSPRAKNLLRLVELVNQASQAIVKEWEREDLQSSEGTGTNQDSSLSTWDLYNARRTMIGTCGALTALVQDPQLRLLEMSMAFLESRALHIAAEHRIPDILAQACQTGGGVYIKDLSDKVEIDVHKLARLMRMLASAHVFEEVGQDCFTNNRISVSLVHNDLLRACILSLDDGYVGSVKLPDVLRNTAHPTSPPRVAFKEAMQTDKPYFDWLSEQIQLPDGSVGPRPNYEIFSRAMHGLGPVRALATYHDFPWTSLGQGAVVDVGGGIGGMSLELAKLYPNLNFIVQDVKSTVDQAQNIWQTEHAEFLDSRVTFMVHDFFKENPVKGADAYVLRCVLHDWNTDECVNILKGIRASMTENSRVLVMEQVMNTTAGFESVRSAPAPLPANYGVQARFAHGIDCWIEVLLHGVERTPQEFYELASLAGLQVAKLWECRGVLWVIEMRLPSEKGDRL